MDKYFNDSPYYHEQTNASSAKKESTTVSVGEWILTYILLCIPLVNLIMLFVWSFNTNTKPSKRTFAKAMLIILLICIVISVIVGFVFSTSLIAYYNSAANYIATH